MDAVAELVPEPTNLHDPNAVQVHIDGMQVGWLPREDAAAWSPYLRWISSQDQSTACRAFVGCRGAWSGNPNIGVSLTVSPGYRPS